MNITSKVTHSKGDREEGDVKITGQVGDFADLVEKVMPEGEAAWQGRKKVLNMPVTWGCVIQISEGSACLVQQRKKRAHEHSSPMSPRIKVTAPYLRERLCVSVEWKVQSGGWNQCVKEGWVRTPNNSLLASKRNLLSQKRATHNVRFCCKERARLVLKHTNFSKKSGK